MVRLKRLAMRVAFLVGFALAWPASAAPPADSLFPLTLIPADTPLVVQLHGLQRTTERLQAMVKTALPGDEKFVALLIEQMVQQIVQGRQLGGLSPDGPLLLAVTTLPRPDGAPPRFAFLGRVTKYADFRDSFLKADERKKLKLDPAGYEVTALDGETAYLIERKGFVIITPDRESADRFVKVRAGLNTRLDREDAERLLTADVSVCVNLAEVRKTYGPEPWVETLKPAGPEESAPGLSDRNGWCQALSGGLSQLFEDGRMAVVAADFRPDGLALSAAFQVGAGTKTGAFLKDTKPAAFSEVELLPARQMAYEALRADGTVARALVPFIQGVLPTPEQSALRQALDELADAGPRSWLATANRPCAGVQVIEYERPARAMAAQIQLYQALAPGDQVHGLPLAAPPELAPQTLEHRGFKLQQVSLVWDLDSLDAPCCQPSADVLKGLIDRRTEVWFGTNGKDFVRIAAKDWAAAQKKLDPLFEQENHVADSKAFLEARKQLPDQANFLGFIDLPLLVQSLAPALQPLLGAEKVDLSGLKSVKAHSSYLGLALAARPEGVRLDLWLPAAGVAEVRNLLEPLLPKPEP